MFLQFNGDSDEQDIVSLTADLIDNPDTPSSTTPYTLKSITRNVNKWNKTVWSWIFEAYGGWLYDDGNNTTDFPRAKNTLTASQTNYAFPPSALVVRGVEVKDQGGVWSALTPTTEERIREFQAEAEFMKTPSAPQYYVPLANSFMIYPAANYTQADSIRVSFTRGSTSFASTDTTKTPGFVSEFHEVLAVGAAFEYCKRKTLPMLAGLLADLKDYEARIKKFYQERFAEAFPPRITVQDAVAEAQ